MQNLNVKKAVNTSHGLLSTDVFGTRRRFEFKSQKSKRVNDWQTGVEYCYPVQVSDTTMLTNFQMLASK
jgi:hypothetical protein